MRFYSIAINPISWIDEVAKRAEPARFILPDMTELMHEERLNDERFAREILWVILPVELMPPAEDFVLREGIMRAVNKGDRSDIKALNKPVWQSRNFMRGEMSRWGGHR